MENPVDITPDEVSAIRLIGSLPMVEIWDELRALYTEEDTAKTIANYSRFVKKIRDLIGS